MGIINENKQRLDGIFSPAVDAHLLALSPLKIDKSRKRDSNFLLGCNFDTLVSLRFVVQCISAESDKAGTRLKLWCGSGGCACTNNSEASH